MIECVNQVVSRKGPVRLPCARQMRGNAAPHRMPTRHSVDTAVSISHSLRFPPSLFHFLPPQLPMTPYLQHRSFLLSPHSSPVAPAELPRSVTGRGDDMHRHPLYHVVETELDLPPSRPSSQTAVPLFPVLSNAC